MNLPKKKTDASISSERMVFVRKTHQDSLSRLFSEEELRIALSYRDIDVDWLASWAENGETKPRVDAIWVPVSEILNKSSPQRQAQVSQTLLKQHHEEGVASAVRSENILAEIHATMRGGIRSELSEILSETKRTNQILGSLSLMIKLAIVFYVLFGITVKIAFK